jgi:hypothetical protein
VNANLTGVLFAGQARRFGGVAVGSDWRVPLVSYQTVRMQSDVREASLSAGVPGSDGGGGWTGGSDGGGGPDGGDEGDGNTDDGGDGNTDDGDTDDGGGDTDDGDDDGPVDTSGDGDPESDPNCPAVGQAQPQPQP